MAIAVLLDIDSCIMEIYKYLARFVKGFLKKDKDPSVFDYSKDCWGATEVSEKRH